MKQLLNLFHHIEELMLKPGQLIKPGHLPWKDLHQLLLLKVYDFTILLVGDILLMMQKQLWLYWLIDPINMNCNSLDFNRCRFLIKVIVSRIVSFNLLATMLCSSS